MRHRGPFDHRFGSRRSRHGSLWFRHRASDDDELDEYTDDPGYSAHYSRGYDDHGDIPAWRQVLNVIGLLLMGAGFLVFMSTFLSATGLFSSSHSGFGASSFSSFGREASSNFTRAVIGFLMMAAGAGLRTIAVAGLAGSGLILSPKRARRDLKPWAKMAGGLIDDATKEVDAIRNLTSARDRSAGQTARPATGQGTLASDSPTGQPTVVKIRCQKCKTLNDEDAEYCDHCGASL